MDKQIVLGYPTVNSKFSETLSSTDLCSSYSVAIGSSASGCTAESPKYSIGKQDSNNATSGIIMGKNNQVSGDHNLIVGNNCIVDGIGNIVIGDNHKVNGTNNIIVSLTKQCIKNFELISEMNINF